MRKRSHTPAGRSFWLTVAMVTAVVILVPVAGLAAGGRFVDDDTAIFEPDIEWLADAGVTLGCNPPANDRYCPNDPVTRGQMAAFMHRLAVNQVVDAATADLAYDASALDGSPMTHYNNPIYGNETSGAQSTAMDGTNQKWAEYSIPALDGGVLVNATASILDTTSTALAVFWIQIDDTVCNNTIENFMSVAYGYAAIDLINGVQSMALTGVAQLVEGNHTLTLCGREFAGGGGDTVVISPSMTAIFSVAGELYVPSSATFSAGPMPGSVQD